MAYYLLKRLDADTILQHEPLTDTYTKVHVNSPSVVGRVPHEPLRGLSDDIGSGVAPGKQSYAVPIEPKAGLFLESFGHSVDEQRFARLFREVWSAHPKWIRKMLVDFWQLDVLERQDLLSNCLGGTGTLNHLVPRIQLIGDWESVTPPLNTSQLPPGTKISSLLSATRLSGFLLQFWAKAFDVLPDVTARHVIAHALMRCFLIANPVSSLPASNSSADEELVNELCKMYGFDRATAFHGWTEATVAGCIM